MTKSNVMITCRIRMHERGEFAIVEVPLELAKVTQAVEHNGEWWIVDKVFWRGLVNY